MSPRQLRPDQAAALNVLHDRVLLTLEFFESAQDFPNAARWRTLADAAHDKRDLRSMRLVAREIEAMTIGLPPHQRDGLEALLRSRLNVDPEAEHAELARRVAAVLRRGSIASEKERRRLEDYAEFLESSGDNAAEAAAVRQLLMRS